MKSHRNPDSFIIDRARPDSTSPLGSVFTAASVTDWPEMQLRIFGKKF
jgi:hypothetical protein